MPSVTLNGIINGIFKILYIEFHNMKQSLKNGQIYEHLWIKYINNLFANICFILKYILIF